MARPKGSKNKTRIVNANVDYAAVVAEKTAEKEKIESEVAALTANLDDLKTQLKAKKAVVFWLEGKLGSGTDEKGRKGESIDFWNVDQRYGKRLHLVRVRVLSPTTNRQLCRFFTG